MAELLLGVDAGGTKTHAAVMDATGAIVGFGVRGTGNWERVGFASAVEAVRHAIDDALDDCDRRHGDVTAATLALAGVDWPTDATAMESAGAGFGLVCTPQIVNDAVAVLFAGTLDGVGCASVAGTGGKAVASDGHTTLATLGIGIGEGGGAGQVVAHAMRNLALAHHGQRSPSALEAAALARAGVADVSDLFRLVARDGWRMPPSFAATVVELAAAGDPLAVDSVETVARQHAADAVGLVDRLAFTESPVPVICAGGLHTAESATFRRAFEAGMAEARWPLVPRVLDVVPVVGSLVHAAVGSSAGLDEQQRSRLLASARSLSRDG